MPGRERQRRKEEKKKGGREREGREERRKDWEHQRLFYTFVFESGGGSGTSLSRSQLVRDKTEDKVHIP